MANANHVKWFTSIESVDLQTKYIKFFIHSLAGGNLNNRQNMIAKSTHI